VHFDTEQAGRLRYQICSALFLEGGLGVEIPTDVDALGLTVLDALDDGHLNASCKGL